MTLFGTDPTLPPLPTDVGTPREELERVIRAALQEPPCVVLFSGGRDSSTLLAIAVDLARREGLPDPIAVTHRYPKAPESIEDDWQRTVIDHIGATEWVQVNRESEHEVFGELALLHLRRHGTQVSPAWWVGWMPPEIGGPPLDAPPHEGELRGTILEGSGGDEVFGDPARPLRAALLAGRRPSRRQLREGLGELLPTAARPARHTAWIEETFTWLTPAARRELRASTEREYLDLRDRYDRAMHHLYTDRDVRAGIAHAAVAANESGIKLGAPFLEPRVVAALARRWGRAYPRSRAEGLRDLVGDLLPDQILERRSKGDYTAAFLGPQSLAWLESWDGTDVDESVVDGKRAREVLLRAGRRERGGDARALGVAQGAFLRSAERG